MKDRLLKQTRHEYSEKQRLVLMVFLAPIFLLLLPWALIHFGRLLDNWAGWSPVLTAPLNWIVGLLLILPSWLLAMWTNYAQISLGRGTPVPLMATQKLIITPPFTLCRNPMTLGTIGMYSGVALLFNSLGALILVLPGTIALLTYIKLIEEKEMQLRFGQEYLDYKARTPFLIPRFWKRRK